MEELLSLITAAETAAKEIPPKYQDYPAIHNSKLMLKKMRRLLGEDEFEVVVRIIRDRPYLNVGLLAAKALDVNKIFSNYAVCLHKVWFYISPLNISMFTAKEQCAYDFYKIHKFEDYEIPGHFAGIDFSKSVLIVLLYKLDDVFQWSLDDDKGNYYAKEIISLPDCLGINTKKTNQKGFARDRRQYIYSLDQEVSVLFSYAASVLDMWSVKWHPVQTKGGCAQCFNRNDREHFIKIFR